MLELDMPQKDPIGVEKVTSLVPYFRVQPLCLLVDFGQVPHPMGYQCKEFLAK